MDVLNIEFHARALRDTRLRPSKKHRRRNKVLRNRSIASPRLRLSLSRQTLLTREFETFYNDALVKFARIDANQCFHSSSFNEITMHVRTRRSRRFHFRSRSIIMTKPKRWGRFPLYLYSATDQSERVFQYIIASPSLLANQGTLLRVSLHRLLFCHKN